MSIDLDALRGEGNALFKQRRYAEAADKYGACAALCSGDEDDRLAVVLSNRAQCYLLCAPPAYGRAMDDARASLHLAPSTKAAYRLASALKGLGRLEEALLAVRDALACDPSNQSLLALKKDLSRLVDKQRAPSSEDEELCLECLNNALNSFASSPSFDVDALANTSVLASVLNTDSFASLMRSASPTSAEGNSTEGKPQRQASSYQELMCSPIFRPLIQRSFPKLAKSCIGVLHGIAARGVAEGAHMDLHTRAALLGQIVHEAMAREAVALMSEYVASLDRHASEAKGVEGHVCRPLSRARPASTRSPPSDRLLDESMSAEAAAEACAADIVASVRLLAEQLSDADSHCITLLLECVQSHRYLDGLCAGVVLDASDDVKGFLTAMLTCACALSAGDFGLAADLARRCVLAKLAHLPPAVVAYCWYLRALAFAGLNCVHLTAIHLKSSLKVFKLSAIDALANSMVKRESEANRHPRRVKQLLIDELAHLCAMESTFAGRCRCIRFGAVSDLDMCSLLSANASASTSAALHVDDVLSEETRDACADVTAIIGKITRLSEDGLSNAKLIRLVRRQYCAAQVLYMEHLYMSAEVKYLAVVLLVDRTIPTEIDYLRKLASAACLNAASCRLLRGYKASSHSPIRRHDLSIDVDSLCESSPAQLVDFSATIYEMPYTSGVVRTLCLEEHGQHTEAVDEIIKLENLPWTALELSRVDRSSTLLLDRGDTAASVALDLDVRKRRNIFRSSVYGDAIDLDQRT